MTPRHTYSSKQLIFLFALAALLLFLLAATLYFLPYLEGYARQHQEESLASDYLEYYIKSAAEPPKSSDQSSTAESSSARPLILSETSLSSQSQQSEESKKLPLHSQASAEASLYWEDDVYYERDGITYTPDYAAGALDCVLMIPKIQLCRGVYTGTMEDILHNLDVWMLTVSQPDCRLGETSYCIYGHNTPRLNLSFNRLQTLELQDTFYLINSVGEYRYRVTDILGVSRSQSTPYIQADASRAEKCYLLTCGRDEYRYLDLVIEGTLESFTPIEEVDVQNYFILSYIADMESELL